MEKITELKEIIRINTPLAEAGCVSSQQLVITVVNAQDKNQAFCERF